MNSNNTLFYTLTTIDPVIVSQSTDSSFAHNTLDHISGSAILGLVANTLYPEMEDNDSWRFFHSGNVQFGSAYLAIENEMTLPTPASWHVKKGESLSENGLSAAINKSQPNPKFKDESKTTQYEQCRGGFITSKGNTAKIQTGRTTRTALNRETGGVKEGSLFSYAYLNAGQTFIGWIRFADTETAAQDKARLLSMLNGEHRIGRSRGSEFGRVSIRVLDDSQTSLPPAQPKISQQGRLTLWCLSDCQCLNALGLPTYTPALSDIVTGAKGGLNPTHSFILTKLVSRYNQARQGTDSEQLLISKGSVMVFDDVEISPAQLAQLQQQGIGLNRQQGLGWVMVNPSWANQYLPNSTLPFAPIHIEQDNADIDQPEFNLATLSEQEKQSLLANNPMLAWLDRQAKQKQDGEENRTIASKLLSAIVKDYQNARAYNRILLTHIAGPSSSQWRRVNDVLRDNHHDWRNAFFVGESAICKAKNDEWGWGMKWDNEDGETTFADAFKAHIHDATQEQVAILLEMLCVDDLSHYAGLKACEKKHRIALASVEENA